jgi:hypothetical protein
VRTLVALLSLLLACSSCAALDQYVTRRAAENERIRAERRAAREAEARRTYGAGTTVRHLSDCEWEVCMGAGSICIHRLADDDLDGEASVACGGSDCDDSDPRRRPEDCEIDDGIDNDCNGRIDEPPMLACRSRP